MKKILVTGAAGMVGYATIKTLLENSKGNYEITALDLKSTKSVKKLKKYREYINIVYGDINDKTLISSLIKDHDYVIHLAAVLPPLADMKPELTKLINYEGTKNIVNAISDYNLDCFLIFSSSISVYGDRIKNPNIKVTDKVEASEYDYYATTKIKTEEYIKTHLKHYTIFRLTGIMGYPSIDPLMFHMPLDTKLEICSDIDTGRALANAVEHQKELNKKTFNLSGGQSCRTTYRKFLIEMFKIYGLNFDFLEAMAFAEKNFHCGYLEDGDELENILHFRKDSLNSYFKRVDKQTNKFSRFFSKLLSKPIIYFLQKKSEPLKAKKENNKSLIKRFFN